MKKPVSPTRVVKAEVVDGGPHTSSPASGESLRVPTELKEYSAYEVVKELGRGGMGVVYLAKHVPMDRLEVLKVLNESLLDHSGAIQRFQYEIRAAAKLNHPNIVTSYNVLPLDKLLVFAMEYVHGMDLHKFIRKHGQLPIGLACSFARQIAAGLQHAHEKALVHRDIKPSNIIVYKEGKALQLKILDFGLAKATSEEAKDSGLTRDGMMLGTPEFMSPEQTLDAAKADIRADIYSLGCTLYMMLAGHAPFRGTQGQILMAHAQEEPKSLTLLRPEVPAELDAAVLKMMAKERGRRYQTPIEVYKALKTFLGSTRLPSANSLDAAEFNTVSDLNAPERDTSVEQPANKATAEPSLVEAQLSLTPEHSLAADLNPQQQIATMMADHRQKQKHKFKQKRKLKTDGSLRTRWPWFVGAIATLIGAIAYLGVLTIKTPNGTIVIENLPDDATVNVDGENVELAWNEGKDKATILSKPGRHSVEVLSSDGMVIASESLALQSDSSATIRVKYVGGTTGSSDPPEFELAHVGFEDSYSKVFLLDCSGSMRGSAGVEARSLLILTLKTLPPDTKFMIVAYGKEIEVFPRSGDYLVANVETLEDSESWIRQLKYQYGGPPIDAIKFAIDHRPPPVEIYLFSDGVSKADIVGAIHQANYRGVDAPISNINTIGFGVETSGIETLKTLAADNGGFYESFETYRKRLETNKSISPSSDRDPLLHAVYFENRRYKVFAERLSWTEARDRCLALGGRLAESRDQPTNEFLKDLAIEQRLTGIWLGATDVLTEGEWVWESGQPWEYSNWGQNPIQPDNNHGTEHYLLMVTQHDAKPDNVGTWSDQPEVSSRHTPGFICEWDLDSNEFSDSNPNVVWINILERMDPSVHQESGNWEILSGELFSLGEGRDDRIELPLPKVRNYELEISCERLSGMDCLQLFLPMGGALVPYMIDGWGSHPKGRAGINGYGGLTLHSAENQTIVFERCLAVGEEARIIVRVLGYHFFVSVNGNVLLDKSLELSLIPELNMGLKPRLMTYGSKFKFGDVRFRSLQ